MYRLYSEGAILHRCGKRSAPARDFGTGEGMGSKEYFVYFEITYRTAGAKDPLRGGKAFQEYAL